MGSGTERMGNAQYRNYGCIFTLVITRLDRVIHMVKVQLNRVYRGTSMLLLMLNAQFTPQRTRTAWIPRSNHVATFYVALVHTGNDGIEKKANDCGRDFILTPSAS